MAIYKYYNGLYMKLYSREKWQKDAPRDLWKSKCPFCEIDQQQEEYIVWEWQDWYIANNKFPYLGIKEHIMAIPKKHICESADISPEAYWEMSQIHIFVKKFFWEKHYFSFTRETFGNRSLEHLHIHFLPWVIYGGDVREMLQKQWF